MELLREWIGRDETAKERIEIQMFEMRTESGFRKKILKVTLTFEETQQSFSKKYEFCGAKARGDVSPLTVAEPALINEIAKAVKNGFQKVFWTLDYKENPYRKEYRESRKVSQRTVKQWQREAEAVYAGVEMV